MKTFRRASHHVFVFFRIVSGINEFCLHGLYVAIWRSSSVKCSNWTYPKCHRSVMHIPPHSCGTTRSSWWLQEFS